MTDSQRTAWVWQMTILVLGGKQNESNNESISTSYRSDFLQCSA